MSLETAPTSHKLWRERLLAQIRQKLTRSHNKIFIIPSRYGFYFIAIVFILFLISLSYGHSLAFTTTFIFVSLVMTSAHFTNYNLAGIEVVALHIPEEVHAGEGLECRVSIRNTSRKVRFDLIFSLGRAGESQPISLESGETKMAIIPLKPFKRGQVSIHRLRIASTFPFGLFYAWKFWRLRRDFIVYPKLLGERPKLPPPMASGQNKGPLAKKKELGADEFLGHQTFEEGMPYRAIDWKAYARGKGLLLKTFVEEAEALFLLRTQFDLAGMPVGDSQLEEELQRMSQLVDQASNFGLTYALALEGEKNYHKFGQGRTFKRDCLKTLALYKSERQVLN